MLAHTVTYYRPGRGPHIETRRFSCPYARWRWLLRNRVAVLGMASVRAR